MKIFLKTNSSMLLLLPIEKLVCNDLQLIEYGILYIIVLYSIVLYSIVLYCIVLYCIVLYCIVLYCVV